MWWFVAAVLVYSLSMALMVEVAGTGTVATFFAGVFAISPLMIIFYYLVYRGFQAVGVLHGS